MKPSDPQPPRPVADAHLWLQAACIFAAAVTLGLIYNSNSPLGIRPEATRLTETAPAKPVAPRTGYSNETVSMTLEMPPGTMPQPAANTTTAAAAPQPGIPGLKWPQVKALLDAGKIVLVDSRPKAAYDLGHIPGAVLLPSTAPLTEIRAFSEKYPKDTALVVYCNSTTCRSSQQLARQLVSLGGFRNVSEMPGGYAEYTMAQSQQPKAKP
jgi:rhodanese-related sulfurtransferase